MNCIAVSVLPSSISSYSNSGIDMAFAELIFF